MNPGLLSEKHEREPLETMHLILKILAGQNKIIKQSEKLRAEEKRMENTLMSLTLKVIKLLDDLSALSMFGDNTEQHAENNQLSQAMQNVLINQDELENHSPRNNLLFYVIEDKNARSR